MCTICWLLFCGYAVFALSVVVMGIRTLWVLIGEEIGERQGHMISSRATSKINQGGCSKHEPV